MSGIQSLIDRQLGIYCRLNYDDILKRLVVDGAESFYGLQSAGVLAAYEQDPPIFACRFAEMAGREHILALANEDGRVAIQDTFSTTSARTLEGFQCHNNAVFDLAWMPGNMSFVTVSGDHTACLWDVGGGGGGARRVLVFAQHTRSVKTCVFRPQEPSVFATGARDGHVLVWDTRAAAAPALVLRPDNCLLSCHSSSAPRAPAPGSHGKRARRESRAVSITGLAFQDHATLLSCGECDGNIKAWDLRKNYSAHSREPLPKHAIPYCGSSAKRGYTSLLVDKARVRLYASCMDDVIYCFNVSTYRAAPERRYLGHENASFYIKTSLSPDGRYLVSGSSDKRAYLWSVERAEPLLRLGGHRAEVTCAAWGPPGDAKLVTCSDDARHYIWRIGRELQDAAAERDVAARAEPVPRAPVPRPPPDTTPPSLKRRAPASEPAGKRARPGPLAPPARAKRCLADFMPAAAGSRDADDASCMVKRLRLEGGEGPRAVKRRLSTGSPPRAHAWGYLAGAAAGAGGAGASFLSPTKRYEARSCRRLSPRGLHASPPPPPPPEEERTPPYRIISFGTPTKDLPDFVMSGEAPHLRLMSPVKKRRERPNWLTQLGRDLKGRRGEAAPRSPPRLPAPPPAAPPARRASLSERPPPRPSRGGAGGTLLKYFNVATKN